MKKRVILITGATSGIGYACTLDCLKQGNIVIALGRKINKLDTLFNQYPTELIRYSVDITDIESLIQVFNSIQEQSVKIDGFIHSAGIEISLPLSATKNNHFDELFKINVYAGFEIAKIISSNKFRPETGASYIMISSVMGIVGELGKTAYSASKGALISGVKSAALELAPKNIRINSICPGLVETEMTKKILDNSSEEYKSQINKLHPLGIGKPEYIADLCTFLLSDRALWITGTSIVIDGGYTAR